jgi:hypothetical protein
MGAAIIREQDFGIAETWLRVNVELLVPEDQRDSFEFHASALFNGKPPFDKIKHEVAVDLIRRCAALIEQGENYMVYGAVDLRKLRRSHYSTARPQDVAFRLCLEGLYQWFDKMALVTTEFGLLICDDTSNGGLKKDLQQTYRAHRGRPLPRAEFRDKPADYLHDDMYFGDSSHSMGLQVADICSYIVLRHLQNKSDDESVGLYKQIEPHIFFGKVVPDA